MIPAPKTRASRKDAMASNPPQKSVASKAKRKNFKKWSFKEYSEYRKVDPYLVPRNSRLSRNGMDAWFYTLPQIQVYDDVYSSLVHVVPEQRYFDFQYMRKHHE